MSNGATQRTHFVDKYEHASRRYWIRLSSWSKRICPDRHFCFDPFLVLSGTVAPFGVNIFVFGEALLMENCNDNTK